MMAVRILATTFSLAATGLAQLVPSVDLLGPGEPGYEDLPAGVAVVDYFVDVAATDVWTAAGTVVQAQNGATLIYSRDPNDAVVLFNPGLDDRYATLLSRPRARDDPQRFTNAAAAAAGKYGPGPVPIVEPTSLSVVWFRSPPGTPGEDGYVARIAIDLGPFADRRDSLQISLAPPAPGLPVLAYSHHPSERFGWANGTYDVPLLNGLDWYLFDPVPEPASLGASAFLICMLPRRLRHSRAAG